MALLTQPYSGIGITLGYRTGSSGSYTSLGLLMDDAEFSGWSRTVIPLPVLASAVLTKTGGRIDYGEFTGSLYFVPGDTGNQEMQTLIASGVLVSWQVQLPDGSSSTTGTTATFSAFLSSYQPSNFTGEDAPQAPFTLTISGIVTVTPGT
jgi:hypothetical protein